MPLHDRSGLELRRRLSLWLGADAADELMNRIPPISWSDIATKHDVERAVDRTAAELRVEIAELRTSVAETIEAQTRRIVAFGFALTGLALTAARFLF